jgi:hypothetical protein
MVMTVPHQAIHTVASVVQVRSTRIKMTSRVNQKSTVTADLIGLLLMGFTLTSHVNQKSTVTADLIGLLLMGFM